MASLSEHIDQKSKKERKEAKEFLTNLQKEIWKLRMSTNPVDLHFPQTKRLLTKEEVEKLEELSKSDHVMVQLRSFIAGVGTTAAFHLIDDPRDKPRLAVSPDHFPKPFQSCAKTILIGWGRFYKNERKLKDSELEHRHIY